MELFDEKELDEKNQHLTIKNKAVIEKLVCKNITDSIVIKYDKLDGSFVKSLPLHHTQRVLEEDENSVTIGLQLRITNDFVMALLARSRSIEIIKPISLRQRVYNTLCDAVERNRV